MYSTSETGHAKNAAAFRDLIAFCTSNPGYNPSASALTIASLTAKLSDVRTALSNVMAAQTIFNNAVNNRKLEFQNLKPLATRIVNALNASGAPAEAVKDAKTIIRKLRGKRAAAEKPGEPAPGTTPPGNSISVSQQSYDQKVQHFSKLIALLSTTATYNPNETELTITALQAKLTALQAAETAVIGAYTAYSNSRIARDEALYNPATGIVATAGNVKKYVKAISGSASPYFDQINGLPFRAIKT